ncbi:orotate phosphoribosyltransferase [Paenibacillus humicola]|uniref:orotate phosphoribosyltransferase n=1 Tax=Paenibacillus humicola TaxID=3110540 RepID=UPI00237B7422|nr:orotate phosphoribosyltransferase [Paenibacillus humicola]
MRDRILLAKDLCGAARLTAGVTNRSAQAQEADYDKYSFAADPRLLGAVTWELSTRVPVGTDVLAGLELSGIPIVTALAMETNLPAAFVRKQAETVGACKIVEGTDVSGKRAVVVVSVVTSGAQVVRRAAALREAGAIVEDVVCVIERSPEGRRALAEHGLRLHALYTMEELLEAAASP